ncbi:MAG: sigma-70 family RNA polymerase sigma factor [Pseudomonadota bacterium]
MAKAIHFSFSDARLPHWRMPNIVRYNSCPKPSIEPIPAMYAPEAQPTVTDPANLAARVNRGDKQAEALVIRTYQRSVLEMLRNRSGDPDLAQDLLQETFIVVLRRLRADGIDQPDKLPAFIHRVAHNLAVGHFRKESRRKTQPDTDAIEVQPDDSCTQLEAILREENSKLVHELLNELTAPRDREVLQRFYVFGEEKSQLCRELALRPEQFDRVISRARQRLRKLAEQELDRT